MSWTRAKAYVTDDAGLWRLRMSAWTTVRSDNSGTGYCPGREPLAGMEALIRHLGADPAEIAGTAGLPKDVFKHAVAHLPSQGWCRLLDAAAEATAYPAFGVIAGRMWHLDCLGKLGEEVLGCASVGHAVELLT